MSDYQQVRLLKKKGCVLTIEVEEDNPDVSALSSILDKKGKKLRASQTDAIKLAAILLLDKKGRTGDIRPPAGGEGGPTPEQFVANVALVSAEQIGTDCNDYPRYRAVLAVTMTKKSYAAAFEVDESWGAAAILGGDFDNCFS